MSKQEWTVVIVLGSLVALASLVGAIMLAVRVWRTRAILSQLGAGGRFAFYGALAYLVLPVDVLPDPIYLDDMGILAGALLYLGRLVSKHRAASVPRQARPPTRSPQRHD
jgi:uncharacterized membrane protein YkvA (DUF1232 family)